jgi:transcriptional regulator with XRE-family HTH domain
MFPERLKKLRQTKGITQKQLAFHFGLTERGYQRYENGTSTPYFKTLIALADYFNVSLDYLVGRSDNPHIS